MARITLENLAHSYLPNPESEDDFALKEMTHVWEDGQAYALLGASGCGKTTLLKLLARVYQPQGGGTIKYFMEPINEVTPELIGEVAPTLTPALNRSMPLRLGRSCLRRCRPICISSRCYLMHRSVRISPSA